MSFDPQTFMDEFQKTKTALAQQNGTVKRPPGSR